MSIEIIIFIVFLVILIFVVQGAIGMYIIGEKGRNVWLGFFIGGFTSFIGLIFLAMIKPTNNVIVDEMYKRELMNFEDYKKTMEFKLKK